MRFSLNIFVLIILLCFGYNGFGQNIKIISKTEKIEVLHDSTFVNEITIEFKKSNESRIYPIFYEAELEKVSNINLYIKKGKRLKQLKKVRIFEEDVELDYIASQKVKSIEIPKNKEIVLKYSVKCMELMYLTSLQFFSYNQIDTLKYQLKIPKKFQLAHNSTYRDSLKFYKIDSTKTNTNSIWNIKVSPKKVVHDPLQFFGIYKNLKVPLMRILVTPTSYVNNPVKYMNDWYLKNISSTKNLNTEAKLKLDEITANITDKNKVIKIIYDYVKNNFKYVAIEIGMGAFIPTHVNEVFKSKQGDCKDLSNFLSEALKYKEIKSDIALASTFNHISDCDFPSLSSANHVICVAYLDGKSILLDPTDPIHIQNTPVQSLQDRTILIINSEGGLFYKADTFVPIQNEIRYQMNLILNSKTNIINGNFNINYHGISDNYLQRNLLYKNEFENFVKLHYEEIFGNQSISQLSINKKKQKLNFKGNISINGKTFNDNLNKYIFIDFLPRLIETENRETLIEGTYLNNPFHKKVKVTIKIDEPFMFFETKEYSYKENDILLKLNVKALSNLEIEVEYDFILNYIFIDNNNVDNLNKILKSFKKIINDPIVLKKEKV